MMWRSVCALALAAGLAAPQAVLAQSQDTRPGIAVMTFDNGGSNGPDREAMDGLQVGLQQQVLTELAQNTQLRIVDRGRLKDIMAEQDLGASGRVDPSTAAKIGKLVGARYMVFGSFMDWNGEMSLTARIIDTETSEMVKTVRAQDKDANLYALVVKLADEVTQGVNLPALPRQALEQRESRKVPTEALTLYSRALLYQDRGDTDKAADLFTKALAVFPEYTEAQESLRQLKQG
jgi:TolB-like protein